MESSGQPSLQPLYFRARVRATAVPGGIKSGYAKEIRLVTHGKGVPVVSYVADADYTGWFAVLDNDGAVTVGPAQYLNENPPRRDLAQ
jgi:hypothetical protein